MNRNEYAPPPVTMTDNIAKANREALAIAAARVAQINAPKAPEGGALGTNGVYGPSDVDTTSWGNDRGLAEAKAVQRAAEALRDNGSEQCAADRAHAEALVRSLGRGTFGNGTDWPEGAAYPGNGFPWNTDPSQAGK
jgi:hypothetical protein